MRSDELRDMVNREANYGLFLQRQHRTRVERVNALLFDIRAALKKRG